MPVTCNGKIFHFSHTQLILLSVVNVIQPFLNDNCSVVIMICQLCQENKLSKEFPFYLLTENCEHPLLHCLRCATASVKNYQRCSQCENPVNERNKKYQEYLQTLEYLFPNLDEDDDSKDIGSSSTANTSPLYLVVTTLSGECATLSYNQNKSILCIKKEIEQELQAPCSKQRLLYQNTELKAMNQEYGLSCLKDYNVPPNSNLCLIILLYEVPEELDYVIFDLFWGYPTGKDRDYLDASVFLYNGSKCLDIVDYEHTHSDYCPSIRHSGDVMDDNKRCGHHRINVSIKSIPENIDKLIFTLSAFNSPNISKYPKPSLRFFDAKFPDQQLCSDEMSLAGKCQSIVMCSLSRINGIWQVLSLKSRASGCAKNYSPLKNKIRSLIGKGCI